MAREFDCRLYERVPTVNLTNAMSAQSSLAALTALLEYMKRAIQSLNLDFTMNIRRL